MNQNMHKGIFAEHTFLHRPFEVEHGFSYLLLYNQPLENLVTKTIMIYYLSTVHWVGWAVLFHMV